MDENINVVNDTQEAIVEPQETVTDISEEISQVADVKPVQNQQQSWEENSRFAQVRRDTEAKTRDALIAELYGQTHGITNYEQYKKFQIEQKQAEEADRLGIDPAAMKEYFDTWKKYDPDFQELSNLRKTNNVNKALEELNAELKDNGVDLQLKNLEYEEFSKIPNVEKVVDYVEKGYSLADAVFLANKKEFAAKQTQQAQQEAIKKISSNGASSPGSLTGNVVTGEGELSEEVINNMTPQQRISRWQDIKKFYNMK